jgi:ABC-2 type transport system permease protein
VLVLVGVAFGLRAPLPAVLIGFVFIMYIIDAMREAYLGHYFSTIMVEGIAVEVGLAVVCLWLGSRVFVQENA